MPVARAQMTRVTETTSPLSLAPTAVIAGNGVLPKLLAQELAFHGPPPTIAAIEGEAGDWINAYPSFAIKSVEIGVLVAELKKRGVSRLVLAGGVKNRPKISSLRFDWVTIKSLPQFAKALRQGDDALLKTFIAVLEAHGFAVVGAHEIMPDLLASQGAMTTLKPNAQDRLDLSCAMQAARELGRLDIGQGAVAVGGRVVAVEGAEGTDAMLFRVTEMRKSGRISANKKGVLVKMAKPGQDMRADLPSIGPDTIDHVAAAGLAGIAVSADCSLILNFAETIKRANVHKIFITGFDVGSET